ncbi:oxygenase MpaB family protein [Sorangium sp. So ce1335]|uniref:oxygenase MpaB family protein n=1 Tax=Sorangium sp. So ce1335 TaxID=3133335 RepID=UPI003F6180A5
MRWIPPGSRSRHAIRDHIEANLEPVEDHQEITFLSTCYDFPWDTQRALELALIRVFGIARSSRLLVQTGEFLERTQKRYDDTVLILSEMLENGYDSERGRAALRRMNQQHRRHTIPNDEYLYTLSTFVFEPVRWNERFGWRPLTEKEKLATYHYWARVGALMNIRDIPPSYEAFERFNVDFEAEHMRFSEDNRKLAVATRDLLLSWVLPRPLRPLGARVVHAILDDRLLDALGLPRPSPALRRLVEGAIRARVPVLRAMPRRRSPRLLTAKKTRTYPDGYRIEDLGAR